jgi:hypothetical protein
MSELQLSKTSKKILIDIYKNSKIKNSNDFEFSYTNDLCTKYNEDNVYQALKSFNKTNLIRLYTDNGFMLEDLGTSTAESLLFRNRFKNWFINNALSILALIVSIIALFLPK